ncbi:MAG: hypothetical protein IJG80_10310 [Selenomonadaceae bacterium]|nr:hypothetical protein [Selenomonadaceae bacterium]
MQKKFFTLTNLEAAMDGGRRTPSTGNLRLRITNARRPCEGPFLLHTFLWTSKEKYGSTNERNSSAR